MPEESVQPQPTSNQKSINWKKISLILIVVLFLISLVGVGIYLLIPRPTENPTPTTQPQKIATPSAKEDETANWSILTSKTIESNPEVFDPTKTINFSFKYPKDFYEVIGSDVTIITNDQDYQLGVKTSGKLAVWARISKPSFKVDSSSDSELGGVKAVRKLADGVVLYHIPSLKTKEGIDVSFVFQCTYLEKENVDTIKTCDLMASTFKFLD